MQIQASSIDHLQHHFQTTITTNLVFMTVISVSLSGLEFQLI